MTDDTTDTREMFKKIADQLDADAQEELEIFLCTMADVATYGERGENPDFAGLLQSLGQALREAQMGVTLTRQEDWEDDDEEEEDDDDEGGV